MKTDCTHPTYKLEADFSADPIWCAICGENLDITEFAVSGELRMALDKWALEYVVILEESNYGENLDNHVLQRLEKHNHDGHILYKKVKFELGKDTDLIYKESSL